MHLCIHKPSEAICVSSFFTGLVKWSVSGASWKLVMLLHIVFPFHLSNHFGSPPPRRSRDGENSSKPSCQHIWKFGECASRDLVSSRPLAKAAFSGRRQINVKYRNPITLARCDRAPWAEVLLLMCHSLHHRSHLSHAPIIILGGIGAIKAAGLRPAGLIEISLPSGAVTVVTCDRILLLQAN